MLVPGESWQVAGAEEQAALKALHEKGMGAALSRLAPAAGNDGATTFVHNASISFRQDALPPSNVVVTHDGRIYATDPGTGEPGSGKVKLIRLGQADTVVDTGLNGDSVAALSPDGLWLCVVESKSHWGYSYQVQPDGTLRYKQRFYWFHVPDWADDPGVKSLCMDRDGRLYAATRMGVQVLDRNGRSRAILPLPGREEATGVCFGGAKLDTLYVRGGSVVYKRKFRCPGPPPGVPRSSFRPGKPASKSSGGFKHSKPLTRIIHKCHPERSEGSPLPSKQPRFFAALRMTHCSRP